MSTVYVLAFIGVTAVSLLWLLPSRQLRWVRPHLAKRDISLSDYLKAENDRVAIAQIIGGLLVLGTLFYNGKTTRLTESGQLTDRIDKAIDALSKNEVVPNLGGIHQIAMIADNWEEERYSMLQVLTSFVEKDAALPATLLVSACDISVPRRDDELPKPTTQAVIAVLSEQMPKLPFQSAALQINHVSLRNVDFLQKRYGLIQMAGDDLTQAHLRGTSFAADSYFSSSLFIHADLTDAHLERVRMNRACMANAQLKNTRLDGADLRYASFRGVQDLNGASFAGARLDSADMRGVDLTGARGLVADQLRTVRCDERTVFPQELATVGTELKCAATPESLD